jgi:hypothetical protein
LCITTVLGGAGTVAFAMVRHPPGREANKFVKVNETYIAGHRDFNAWALRFPGDNGLVDASFVSGKHGGQDEYRTMHKCRARVVTYIAVNRKLGYVVCLWTLN